MNLQTESKGTYLYAVLSGTYTLSEAKSLAFRAFDICKEYNLTKILFDARTLHGSPTIMERYEYVTSIVEAVQQKFASNLGAMKFAFVGYTPLIDPHKFGETVATNRGLNVKVTSDLAEACTFLGIEPPV